MLTYIRERNDNYGYSIKEQLNTKSKFAVLKKNGVPGPKKKAVHFPTEGNFTQNWLGRKRQVNGPVDSAHGGPLRTLFRAHYEKVLFTSETPQLCTCIINLLISKLHAT